MRSLPVGDADPLPRGARPAGALRWLAVVLAVALVGCSGGDTDAPSATDTRSTTPQSSTTASTPAPPLIEQALETTAEPAGVPGLAVYRPADLDAAGGPLPVVVWANGGCVRFEGPWVPLLDRWAAAGFVVIAITALPDREPSLADPSSVDDQAAAIDWAAEQDQTAGSPYEGRLDLDRVIAAGNSCGGITAVGLAASDERVKGVFVLSGSSTIPGAPREQVAEVMGRVEVPIGYAVGAPDEDIATAQARQDLELLGDGIGGFVASRDSGDHVTVSTTPEILDEVADLSINWLDLVLNGNETARANLTDAPCAACPPGRWTLESRDLDAVG